MEIKVEKRSEVKIIELRGRLDATTSPGLEKKIQSLLDQGVSRIVFDCAELTYISSLGLRVLIVAAKNLRKIDGKLALAALNEHIYEVFRIAGFTSVFSIYPNREEAITNCAV